MSRLFAPLALLLAAVPAAAQVAVPTALADYMAKPEPAFAWSLTGKTDTPAGRVYDLSLTSQTWQGITWKHGLQVFVPKDVPPQKTMVIWNQGGTPNPGTALLGVTLSQKVNAPVAFLYGIPNQPLFNGKKEDALIAETFVRYLETKDPSWPLLFPMAKSLVKCMDALQAFAKQEWQYDVESFVVTGASKRGWTSWLTAATGDKRVKAIAPLVIDTLNFKLQIPNQLKSFGRYSEMIHDYEERKLLPLPDTDDARRLWAMVDPWAYKDKLTLPKMLIHGTNDPYWSQDSTNLYWDDLKGDKYLLYVPNAGHGLDELLPGGAKSRDRGILTLAAYCRHIVYDLPLPKVTWKHTGEPAAATLTVAFDKVPLAARTWTATSPTRDFRKAKWTPSSEVKTLGNGTAAYTTTTAAGEQYRAFFAELDYDIAGVPFHLSTQLRILDPKK